MFNGIAASSKARSRSILRHVRWSSEAVATIDQKIPFIQRYGTPEQCYSRINELKKSDDLQSIWKFSMAMKDHNIPLNSYAYLHLLEWFAQLNSATNTKTAIETYYDAMTQYKHEANQVLQPLTAREKTKLSEYLIQTLRHSDDFTDLAILNLFWENYMKSLNNDNLEILYHSTYVNILFNTGQNEIAFEYFDDLLTTYLQQSSSSVCQILDRMPIKRFLGLMISCKNCSLLEKWLMVILEAETLETKKISRIDGKLWLHILSMALTENNYELVKRVHDDYIMKEFQNASISTEDAIFTPIYHKSILTSLTDELILQILHTFSTHGDVDRTLTLIESLFLHKFVQGEKALTKELCVKIIEAYCYNPDLKANWDGNDLHDYKHMDDESIMGVLGVLNGFITKFKQDGNGTTLDFKDISSSLSYKFWNYQTYDENVEHAINRQKAIAKKIEALEENSFESTVLPKKLSNPNIASSNFGNNFANMATLEKFVESHFQFLQTNSKFFQETITIFLNCLFNHLFLFQNFTAALRVLIVLERMDSRFVKYLDQDSYVLLFNLMGMGTATKKCSITLYECLKQNGYSIPVEIYCQMLEANFRGYCHDGVQYIMYEYLTKSNTLDQRVLEKLQKLPVEVIRENEGTEILMKFCTYTVDLSPGAVDAFWKENNLCKDFDQIVYIKHSRLKRDYRPQYDIRDAEMLKHIFSIDQQD